MSSNRRPKPSPPSPAPSSRRSSTNPHDGGVPISSPSKQKSPSPPAAASSNRRRRPRKLRTQSDAAASAIPTPVASNDELAELKQRVLDIEAQVRALAQPGKSARRRTRTGTGTNKDETTKDDSDEKESKEMELLRLELARARQEIASVRERRAAAKKRPAPRSRPSEDDEVEEIPRDAPRVRPDTRPVAISGSYRIALPETVSEGDVLAVQKGLSSVQNIARKVMAESRADGSAARQRTEIHRSDAETQGWGSWLGGYTMSVARFVNGIHLEADSGMENENQQRPGMKWSKTEPTRRKPPKLEVRNRGTQQLVRLDRTQAAG
ncbi:hypothetical protein BT63DRAFT_423264 [Microthyrium microscopicum]|uniref:Uncharacterized protein n=1 Tax=Microthyrium microscopicum TaxID=703497 RepID=A0A6A6UHU3_9PEZI|nr:hypothetical protein BT63DRAFT_423264 [Microthyrium microscopicum]